MALCVLITEALIGSLKLHIELFVADSLKGPIQLVVLGVDRAENDTHNNCFELF